MNQLSWLLYLADLSQGLGRLLFLLGLGSLAGFVGVILAIMFHYEDYNDKKEAAFKATGARYASRFLIFTIVIWTICAAVPSRNTIYAIAISEYGEKMLKTPLAGKAEKALEAWLDRQIAQQPAKKED